MSEQAKVVSGFIVGIVLALVAVVGLSALRTSFVDAAIEAATTATATQPAAFEALPQAAAQPTPARLARVAARPVAVQPVSTPAVAEQPAVTPVTAPPAPGATTDTHRRSWPKTAMVIGGSTAAGAGVGAIVGGKKGALVGAAIGGGASTIYETTRR
jgi:uncharacterized membrane protein